MTLKVRYWTGRASIFEKTLADESGVPPPTVQG